MKAAKKLIFREPVRVACAVDKEDTKRGSRTRVEDPLTLKKVQLP